VINVIVYGVSLRAYVGLVTMLFDLVSCVTALSVLDGGNYLDMVVMGLLCDVLFIVIRPFIENWEVRE